MLYLGEEYNPTKPHPPSPTTSTMSKQEAGPPATGGVRKLVTARRSLDSSFETAGGAAQGGNVIVRGTPPLGDSGDDRASAPRIPPGAFVFRHPVDPRLVPRLVPVPPMVIPAIPAIRPALVRRADSYIESFAEPPPKRFRHDANDMDDNDKLTVLKSSLEINNSAGRILSITKRALHKAFKEQFVSIKADHGTDIAKVFEFTEKIMVHMSYDASNIENMEYKFSVKSDELITAVAEQGAIDADHATTIADMKGYIGRLKKQHTVGTSLANDLFLELQDTTRTAVKAQQVHVTKYHEMTTELIKTSNDLLDCRKLLDQRTDVMKTLLLATEIPSCDECHTMLLLGPAETLNKTECGRTLCRFCVGADKCPSGICNDRCTEVYKTTVQDFIEKVNFTRKHVRDNNPRSVIEFLEHAPLPSFLADYTELQHKIRMRDADASPFEGSSSRG